MMSDLKVNENYSEMLLYKYCLKSFKYIEPRNVEGRSSPQIRKNIISSFVKGRRCSPSRANLAMRQ